MTSAPQLRPAPHDAVVCGDGCRADHRGDARYEAVRRAYLLERARARRDKAA